MVMLWARYGLPVSFQTLLLQPQKKQVKRLREELNSVFSHLDPMAVAGKQDVSALTPIIMISTWIVGIIL